MLVCVYSMFLLFCVRSDIAIGRFSILGVLTTVYGIKKTEKEGKAQQNGL
jgi:hypothetical protein